MNNRIDAIYARQSVDKKDSIDYKAFADCIQMILDEYGIDIPNRRRKFDLFLWYANRKKQIL